MKGFKVARPATCTPSGAALAWLSARAFRGEMNPVFMSCFAFPLDPEPKILGGGLLYSVGEETKPLDGCGPIHVYRTIERARAALLQDHDRVLLEVDYDSAPAGEQALHAGEFHYPDPVTIATHAAAGETWRAFLFGLGEDYATRVVPVRVISREEILGRKS